MRVPSVSWISRLMVKTAHFAQVCAGLEITIFVYDDVLPAARKNEMSVYMGEQIMSELSAGLT